MKRTGCLLLLLAGLGGCASMESGPDQAPWAGGGAPHAGCAGNMPPQTVPETVGWNGAPVPMIPPYTSQPPRSASASKSMMWNSVPLDMVEQVGYNPAVMDHSKMHAAGGAGAGAIIPAGLPGMPPFPGAGGGYPPGVVAGVGMNVPGTISPFKATRTQVRFIAPSGMNVTWYSPGPDGKNTYNGPPVAVPGRYNFNQAAIYRLKLSDIPGRQGLELYPTLEVVPTNGRTADFLAHSPVPVTFTDDDFDQVISGNFVVKVIYLPDPQFQDLANPGGAGEVVSTRLEPGVDPIAQAQSRGNILLVIRMGHIDLEAPNTPPMDAPNPFAPAPKPAFPGMGMGAPGGTGGPMGPMVPYGFAAGGMGGGPQGMPGMMPQGPMPPGMPPGVALPPGAIPYPTAPTTLPPAGPGTVPSPVLLPPTTGGGPVLPPSSSIPGGSR